MRKQVLHFLQDREHKSVAPALSGKTAGPSVVKTLKTTVKSVTRVSFQTLSYCNIPEALSLHFSSFGNSPFSNLYLDRLIV